MKKHRAYAKKNAEGFWVGCMEYPDGTHSEVTNAKHCESAAMGIAERMAEQANEMDEKKRQQVPFWQYPYPANAAGEVRRNAVTSTGLLAGESKGGEQ